LALAEPVARRPVVLQMAEHLVVTPYLVLSHLLAAAAAQEHKLRLKQAALVVVEQRLAFRGLYRVRQEIRQILRHLKVIMEEAHLLQLRITEQVVAVERLP
jgi:hypothetical protein